VRQYLLYRWLALTIYRNSRRSEIEKMESDIRQLSKRAGGGADSDDEPVAKKPKRSALAEELSKYAGARGKSKKAKRKDEDDVMGMLNSFRTKLQQTSLPIEDEDEAGASKDAGANAPPVPDPEDPGIEVDDDIGFLGHALHFHKGNEEEVEKAERDYEVIDPRARGARAREKEKERKAKEKRSRPAPGAPRRR
jgi:peptidyl-prolyl cis-trans isomerase SDCCAG10